MGHGGHADCCMLVMFEFFNERPRMVQYAQAVDVRDGLEAHGQADEAAELLVVILTPISPRVAPEKGKRQAEAASRGSNRGSNQRQQASPGTEMAACLATKFWWIEYQD